MAETCRAGEASSNGSVERAEFDPVEDDVVVQIVRAIEEFADGLDGRGVLNDAIDPDALRRCLDSGGPGTSVSFRFGEYSVVVLADGKIRVEY